MGKGESFEREMCRYLSLWWTEVKHSDVFWRSRVRATRKSPDAKHQLGDIKSDSPEGEGLMKVFSIELKTGYSVGKKGKTIKNVPWDLLDLIDYRKGSEDLAKSSTPIVDHSNLGQAPRLRQELARTFVIQLPFLG